MAGSCDGDRAKMGCPGAPQQGFARTVIVRGGPSGKSAPGRAAGIGVEGRQVRGQALISGAISGDRRGIGPANTLPAE
ncbi:hypothetical protein MASR2M74_13070 [Paracoccaceae bacterium]